MFQDMIEALGPTGIPIFFFSRFSLLFLLLLVMSVEKKPLTSSFIKK